jgi:ferric-dicitrate binding protein FerR (iron transport regulator)
MDELIDREQRGEASAAELQELIKWRRASIANEYEYRRLVRMLGVTRTLVSSLRSEPPSAASVLGRRRDDPPAIRTHPRWTRWLIALRAVLGRS